MVQGDEFSAELERRFTCATRNGAPTIDVSADDLLVLTSNDPGPEQLRICCDVMCAEMKDGDRVLTEPRDGPVLVVRYRIPR